MQLLSGHVLSISETGCKDLGKGLPSALSPKEKILVESFETKKKKEVPSCGSALTLLLPSHVRPGKLTSLI